MISCDHNPSLGIKEQTQSSALLPQKGNNTWIAAGAIICAGVTIGDNSVIGAGSVVTRNIPADVFACGVPCRVVSELDDGGKNELVSEVSDK